MPQADALGEALERARPRALRGAAHRRRPTTSSSGASRAAASAKNGHIYHVEFDPPKHDDVCDVDGSTLVQRDDDKPETIRKRLAVYHEQTEPLVEYYEDRDLLRRFDGTRSPTEVHDHIRATVATLRLEDEL